MPRVVVRVESDEVAVEGAQENFATDWENSVESKWSADCLGDINCVGRKKEHVGRRVNSASPGSPGILGDGA